MPPMLIRARSPRVLVVEDEAVLALRIADILEDAGFEVVGPAYAFAEGLRLARAEALDAAILDVNLGPGPRGDEIAETLCARGTPFLFVTAYDRVAVTPQLRGFSFLRKPFSASQLISQLEANLERSRTGS